MTKISALSIGVALAIFPAGAQEKAAVDPNARWEKDIAAFEAADAKGAPPKDSFLFVGSSSIRLWDLDASFPGVEAINRGFGGSEIENSTHFADRIIVPHQPHTVLLYAGDNDVAKGKSADRVVDDFQLFVAGVHKDLPETHIAFIAIKPSIKRWEMWPTMKAANDRIAAICSGSPKLTFLDIAKVTIGDDGKPDPALFAKDGLHLNAAGYKAWSALVSPLLDSRRKAEDK